MSNEFNIQDQRTKLNKSSSAIASTLLGKIQAYKNQSKNVLLIDTSGSMGESVSEDGKEWTTKDEIMRRLLEKVPAGITKYHFTNICERVFDRLPAPSNGTNMSGAFDTMRNAGIKEFVLITDGMPDSAKMALDSSKGLKIDIIYIGPQPKPKFLEDLAGKTGGSFTNIDLLQKGATLELENKVTLLLGS